MPTRLYDRWPCYVGQQVRIDLAQGTVEGTMVGVRSMYPRNDDKRGIEPPWALSDSDGHIHYVDPDNDGLDVFADGLQISKARRTVIDKPRRSLGELLKRSNDVVANALSLTARLVGARSWHRRPTRRNSPMN